jgi:ATP-dependent DNA helicase RecQ
LVIDQKAYAERKARYLGRLKAMIHYVEGKHCRSQIMQQYFGEREVQLCGTCDICIAKKRKKIIRHEQLLLWLNAAKGVLRNNPLDAEDLRKQLRLTRNECDQMIELGLKEEILLIRPDSFLEINPKMSAN